MAISKRFVIIVVKTYPQFRVIKRELRGKEGKARK